MNPIYENLILKINPIYENLILEINPIYEKAGGQFRR